MAGSTNNEADGDSELKLSRPRALASIRFNAIAAEQDTSEDEAPEEQGILAEDAQTAIGVSIGAEQVRLTSPTTPAAEKAGAIENAYGFFGQFDGIEETLVEEPGEQDDDPDTDIELRDEPGTSGEQSRTNSTEATAQGALPRRTEVQLPSPWRLDSQVRWQLDGKSRSGLLDGIFNRRRAASGPDTTLESWQRSLLSSLPSLPSMPKNFSISSPFSSSREAQADDGADSKRSSILFSSENLRSTSTAGRPQRDNNGRMPRTHRDLPFREPAEVIPDLPSRPSLHSTHSRAGLLRRSTSDQSLVTQRTLSLGDDSRFENVQDQVNSRFKAIKDSWQDSNLRMPRMPNLNVPNFTPDFLKERVSPSRVQSIKHRDVDAGPRGRSVSMAGMKPVDPLTRQPYTSGKAALADATKAATHPHFSRALDQLEGDVVVLGGYRGSILRAAQPPHRQLWVPVKVGLNLRKANLELGLEEEDDEHASKTIVPDGMLTHIGPVDIARRLLKRLRACENVRTGKLRVHDFGYDWRLNPNRLSKLFIQFFENLPCNQHEVPKEKRGATVIAHSLGGMITRHAVNERPELFKGVVYAGVPTTCVNILGPMRNGDEVLLSDRVLTAQVNFTIRTSYALLPLNGKCFFNKETKEEYPVDFFDVKHWIDYRWSPCVGRPLPPFNVPPKATGITGYVSSMANALPSLPMPGRRGNQKPTRPDDPPNHTANGGGVAPEMQTAGAGDWSNTSTNANPEMEESDASTSVRTAVTIPREEAIEYLERTLASVKRFKQELAFNPAHAESNLYPPIALIYGKSTPTVYGAKVKSREAIKHADAYDELAFASGDGVVLARAAMVPKGYTTARGGIVASDRGHVTLLGDLEAVGKCLNAIIRARRKGIGCGNVEA